MLEKSSVLSVPDWRKSSLGFFRKIFVDLRHSARFAQISFTKCDGDSPVRLRPKNRATEACRRKPEFSRGYFLEFSQLENRVKLVDFCRNGTGEETLNSLNKSIKFFYIIYFYIMRVRARGANK